MSQHEVSFDCTNEERQAAKRIAERYNRLLISNGFKPLGEVDVIMDLIATHANGCPLDFARLERADDFNLMHDVDGIGAHLDRDTGELGDCFLPRFARKPVQA
jgi:hypothetical protein